MFQFRKSHLEDEDGFTLIELVTTILVMSYMLGMAIPTFIGAQDKAHDRVAQSHLKMAIKVAIDYATERGYYWNGSTSDPDWLDPQEGLTSEPGLQWVGKNDVQATTTTDPEAMMTNDEFTLTSPKQIAVIQGWSTDVITLAARSNSGRCFYISHVLTDFADEPPNNLPPGYNGTVNLPDSGYNNQALKGIYYGFRGKRSDGMCLDADNVWSNQWSTDRWATNGWF